MKKEAPPPAADEVVFRPTNKEYPHEPQMVLGKRTPAEFDVVTMKFKVVADAAQMYADFSKREVRVLRSLLDRSLASSGEGKAAQGYVVRSLEATLPYAGVDIVPLGPNVVAFRADKTFQERMEAQRPAPATPEQIAAATAAMSEDRFWQLIEAVGCGGRGGQEEIFAMATILQASLSRLRAEEILGFQFRLNEYMAESYRWDLWAVAYIINGGASDDGFEYFRGWLISQGRAYYEAALKKPVRAADRAGKDYQNENEQILYVAMEAYRAKTDQDMPTLPYSGSATPGGKAWKEEELPKLYPELTKRF